MSRGLFLTVPEVAERLSSRAKPVRRKQVYQWVNVGVKVPGGERVKLRCTRLPGGMVFLESDISDFIERMNAAWARGDDRSPTPRAAAVVGVVAPSIDRPRPNGFARCAPGEIGTYPVPRRGRLVGGGGRHTGRRAAAPVTGTKT